MNTIDKIITLIKFDKEIAEDLFFFTEFPTDVKLWTGLDEDSFDYTNISWLFATYQENLNLIGVNIVDKTIWCIDNEGDFHKDCDSLQDLPYEILRIESYFTKNETVEDYFEKVPSYKETLERYEQWCKDNNIELDKNHIYHDKDGKLFTKYFEINK